MNLIAFCVRRPVFTIMVTLIAVLLGIESYRRLSLDLLPELDFPTITVSVAYENASPEEMETLVAEYVEEAVAGISGVKEITTTCAEGITNVRVTLNWGTDLDVAANDMRDRLDRIIDELPDDADRPQLRRFDSTRSPVAVLGIAADIDPIELRQIVDEQIQYRIERIPGVAESDVWGGFEREIQVRLDVQRIKVSLTLVPALCARLLDDGLGASQHNPFMQALERGFNGLDHGYGAVLHEALRTRMVTLGLIAALFAGSLWAGRSIGTEFMPKTDTGQMRVNLEMETGTRLAVVDERSREAEAIVKAHVPEAQTTVVSVDASSWRPAESARGSINVNLVPLTRRTRSSEEIANALRSKLAAIPGATVRTRAGEGLRVLNLGANEDDNVQVEVRGFDYTILDGLAREVETVLNGIEGVSDAQTSRDKGQPQDLVHINRERAADLGLSVQDIARALETSIAGSRAGNFRQAGDEFRILVQIDQAEKLSLDEILDLTVRNREGNPWCCATWWTSNRASDPTSSSARIRNAPSSSPPMPPDATLARYSPKCSSVWPTSPAHPPTRSCSAAITPSNAKPLSISSSASPWPCCWFIWCWHASTKACSSPSSSWPVCLWLPWAWWPPSSLPIPPSTASRSSVASCWQASW